VVVVVNTDTPTGQSVQSVTLHQCGGLILFSSDCCVDNIPSVHSKLGSKTLRTQSQEIVTEICFLRKERQEVKIQWL
jgi:hypothetical protein